MDAVRRGARALILLALAWIGGGAVAQERVALLIGNAAYEHANALANPGRDVTLLAATLEALPEPFAVESRLDLTRAEMAQAVSDFLDRTRGADLTLVYYAGHGLQFDGENYLLGTDARLASEFDLASEAIALSALVEALRRDGRTALVFIDACRDNPLARSFQASLGAETRALLSQGLAPVELPPAIDPEGGTLLAFSASPGQVAFDGPGGSENSPFAQSLATHLRSPEVELLSVIRRVIGDVRAATGGRQVPIFTNDLAREIYLAGLPGAAPAGRDAQGAPGLDPEAASFTAALEAGTAEALAAHLAAFPEGRLSGPASRELERLASEDESPPAASPAPEPASRAAEVPPETMRVATGLVASLVEGHPKARDRLIDRRAEDLPDAVRRAIQVLLRDQGLYDGAIDGVFGRVTLAALEAIAPPPLPAAGPPPDAPRTAARLTEPVPVDASGLNRGLTRPTASSMRSLLGEPRGSYGYDCAPVTDPYLALLIETRDVGPLRATLVRPALDSLARVLDRVAREDPALAAALGNAGDTCAHLVAGSGTAVSSHAWGTAIDLSVAGVTDTLGDGLGLRGLAALAPAFNAEGWHWAGGSPTEDAGHFQVAEETLRRWRAEGRL